MEFTFSVNINSSKEKVWELYSEIDKWYIWEEDLEAITLDGDFVTGTLGTMTLEGMPPLAFKLTKVIPYQEFWDESETPVGKVIFGHHIFENGDYITVTHTIRLENNQKENVDFLKQIFSDVPDSVFMIKTYLER